MGKRKESQEISIGPILVYVDVCELAELGCLTVPLPGASNIRQVLESPMLHPLNFITQVELKALLNRLLMLLKSDPLSAADLQKAAESPSADPRPPVCGQLVRRLLLSLLLWTPEGHAVAWEAVTHVSCSFSKLHHICTL